MDLEVIHDHLRSQYEGVFTDAQIDRHLADYVEPAKARELLDILAERAPDARTLLDIGSGYGSFVLVAREAGIDAVGIEPADVEVAFARARLAELRPGDDAEHAYHGGDARRLPWPDGSFDAVTLWNVLEHIPEAPLALAEAARVLAPGGTLLAIAPNYASFRREAHYGVAWPPLMPKPLGAAYLRRIGRDPRFWLEDVEPCTMVGVTRALRRAGLELRDRRAEKLADPEAVNNPAVRQAATLIERAGLTRPLQAVAAGVSRNPLARTIFVEATKPAA